MKISMDDLAVFDTNIVIDWLNGYSGALDIYSRYEHVAISRVTYAEVLVGYKDDETNAIVAELLEACFIIDDTTEDIANEAVKARQRTRVGLCDAFIYATALVRGCIVYSRNPKDFEKLKGLKSEAVKIPYKITADISAIGAFRDTEIRINGMNI